MFQLVTNGLRMGHSLRRLVSSGMDPGSLRPWNETDKDGNETGRTFVTLRKRGPGGSLLFNTNEKTGKVEPAYHHVEVHNAPTTMTREMWLRVDEAVAFQAKKQFALWRILRGAVPFNIPNGFGTPAIQHQIADGDAVATISMDPIRRSEMTRPLVDTGILPLPVIHSDGNFTARQIAITSGTGMDLDTGGVTRATRAVVEMVEQLALGALSSYSWAGGTIYGLLNHPQRYTKVLTVPTLANFATVVQEIAVMLQTLRDDLWFGPFVAFYSPYYDQWFGSDYSVSGSSHMTLRERTAKFTEITSWTRLDYLTGKQIIIAQLEPDNIQAVEGMGLTTVRWQGEGGMEEHFKVMVINVPRLRTNYANKIPIMHGTAP